MIKKILIVIVSVLFMSCGKSSYMNQPLVIAHRGGASLWNENTLSAFANAIQLQCDFIELDVHLTKDNQLVVCHDATINRTTNGVGAIEDLTLDEIKQFQIMDFRSHEAINEHIPTLDEVLNLVNHRCRILLEIKRNRQGQYPGIEEKVVAALRDYGSTSEYIVQSFDDEVIETVHRLDSTIRVEKLIFFRLPFNKCFDGHIHSFSVQRYAFCRSINICWLFATKRFIRSMHEHGMEVKVWTVDQRKLTPQGADAVITNRPDRFLLN